MTNFIIFLLATTGLVFVTNKSTLFRPFREYVSAKYIVKKLKYPFGIFWFINNLLNCSLCFGFWASIPMYLVIYKTINIELIAFVFAGAIVSYFISLLTELMARK